ncbi:MAG: tRNA-dihydrouridine synthase [Lachnospiraceae bacterium]|nr:tRNA-dihydrouridine synthase [Lachnospiraceae bacterium]
MKLYFAPMEGITGRFFRNAYESVYTGQIDKYFAPFITCAGKKGIAPKDLKELLPENNPGIHLVPQVLVNKPEDFGYLAQALKQIGYDEINLNLGCPSKTVVSKGRGAGFLKDPEALDRFLEAAFDICEKSKQQLSIKTRLGMEETEEFDRLYEIYQQYPCSELIIHPRLQKDYYKYPVRTSAFDKAWETRKDDQLVYNGDITGSSQVAALKEKYSGMPAVMIGRGFLMRPYLADMIRGNEIGTDNPAVAKIHEKLWLFHDRLYAAYKEEMPGARAVLFKMKELWFYLAESFPVTDDEQGKRNKKALKQIKKSQRLEDYEGAMLMLRLADMDG